MQGRLMVTANGRSAAKPAIFMNDQRKTNAAHGLVWRTARVCVQTWGEYIYITHDTLSYFDIRVWIDYNVLSDTNNMDWKCLHT